MTVSYSAFTLKPACVRQPDATGLFLNRREIFFSFQLSSSSAGKRNQGFPLIMGSISSKIASDYRSTPATMGGVFGIASQISDLPRPMRLGISRLGPIGLDDCKVGFPKIHSGGGIAGEWRSYIFDGYWLVKPLQYTQWV